MECAGLSAEINAASSRTDHSNSYSAIESTKPQLPAIDSPIVV